VEGRRGCAGEQGSGVQTPQPWDKLYRRLDHSRKPGCRYPESAIDLAAFLLKVPRTEIHTIRTSVPLAPSLPDVTLDASSAPPPHSMIGALSERRLVVNCPTTTSDHRVLVVGQLPDPGHHPAVFVRFRDDAEFWYPQFAEHNPLKAGCAFCCLVHLGDPKGIRHGKRLPVVADVRVFALLKPWAHGSQRLTQNEFDERLQALSWADDTRFSVSRLSHTVDRVAIVHQAGTLHFEGPRIVECMAPVRLQWEEWRGGRQDAQSSPGCPDQA
jgi:hypothetical protein